MVVTNTPSHAHYRGGTTPFIEVKVFEGEFDEEERKQLIRAVTDATVSLTGEAIRPYTWGVLHEIKSGNWGIGANAVGLDDVRAIQAAWASAVG